MSIIFKHGDLLQEQADAIINTVNCVGIMGKGIALQFKQKWPDNFKAYAKACKNNEIQLGKVFVFKLESVTSPPYYIINFPTKFHWRNKSELSFIEEGLQDLINVIKLYNIRSIAIPPLGCGNGGLDWHLVKPLIINHFSALQQIVEVYLYEPKGAPKADQMEINTKKPALTLNRAVLIKLITIYNKLHYFLGKIEIQKLCYFAQEAGQPLKLQFQKNQYGPYADKLRNVLNDMNGHYIEGVGDHDTSQAQITLKPNAIHECENFLKDYPDSLNLINKVAKLIEDFETPYGMELLATVHWAVNYDCKSTNLNDITHAIYNWESSKPLWNKRKQTLMTEHHIKVALNRLIEQGWVPTIIN